MLTPCHETPGYSHLHVAVPLVILDCSPQLDGCANPYPRVLCASEPTITAQSLERRRQANRGRIESSISFDILPDVKLLRLLLPGFRTRMRNSSGGH